jgi:hypothetical protein
MRAHPPTPSLAAGRRSRGSLSERFRGWRRQPRKQSPRLFWGLLALAALLDIFVAGLAISLLSLTAAGWTWFESPARRPWVACLAAAAILGSVLGPARRRPWQARGLFAAGLLGFVAAIAWATAISFGPKGAGGAASALTAMALLAAALGLLLAWTSRTAVFAFAGALVSALFLFGCDGWPAAAGPQLPAWTAVLQGGGWNETRGLLVLSGYAALALAWGLGNLTLGLILLAPHRGSSIREWSGGAFRALRLGVILLGAGAAMGRMPSWLSREACEPAVALAGLLLLHARFAGWVQDLGLALGCVGGFAALVLAWCGTAWLPGAWGCFGWLCCAALANASLALHATRRYWFTPPADR